MSHKLSISRTSIGDYFDLKPRKHFCLFWQISMCVCVYNNYVLSFQIVLCYVQVWIHAVKYKPLSQMWITVKRRVCPFVLHFDFPFYTLE